MSDKTYKWTLRKGGKKEVCPNCGQRRFVPYVLSADNATPLGREYGRCDREDSCGYWKKPDGSERVQTIMALDVPQPEWMRVDKSLVERMADEEAMRNNSLRPYAEWLVGKERCDKAFRDYRIGTRGDTVVFWQIDRQSEVHAGKMIRYGVDGHRRKDCMPAWWVHKVMPQHVKGDTLQQCFFGEHLLDGDDKMVAVVESEKTALLMSVMEPTYTWLASGGSHGLGEEKCKALQGRDVVLVPDHGKIFDWSSIAIRNGWSIDTTCAAMSDTLPYGYDILDVYERRVIEGRRPI